MEDKFNEIWSRVVRSNQGENMNLSPEYMNIQNPRMDDLNIPEYVSINNPPVRNNESSVNNINIQSTLEDFIENEATAMQYYAALAGKTTQSAARAVFNRLSADERRHSRQLQTAYFLLTGNSYTPRRPAPVLPRSMLEALRERYAAEINAAKAYTDAAMLIGDTDEPGLRNMFIAFAADERRHANEIKRLVENTLS